MMTGVWNNRDQLHKGRTYRVNFKFRSHLGSDVIHADLEEVAAAILGRNCRTHGKMTTVYI